MSRSPGDPLGAFIVSAPTDAGRQFARMDFKSGKLDSELESVMSEKILDSDLVKRASAGDKEAYRALVEKYQKRVLSIAFEVLKSREDAEDVAQEAFVKAFLSLPEFKGQSSFYTWIYRIAYNMAIDYRRRVSRRGGATQEFDESRADAMAEAPFGAQNRFVGPHEAIQQKEESKQIQEVMEQISPEHRTVIALREIDGLSYDEIADVVGVSKGTVMSRLHYARKRLQQALLAMGVRSAVADESGADEDALILQEQRATLKN